MALAVPRQYDIRNLAVTYGGVQIEGFADGDVVTITADADALTAAQGADGEVVVNQGPTRLHTATLRLMQTSSSLPYLISQALLQAQGAGSYLPLVIIDQATGQATVFDRAWIKRVPDQSFGAEAGTREVVFGGVPVITPPQIP